MKRRTLRYWLSGLGITFSLWAGLTQAQTLSVLHSFNGVDGSVPEANLIVINSNLYGGTFFGGENGSGSVFKLTTTGNETVLHNFAGADGANSGSGLIFHKGSLYGTTFYGGAYGYGAVFKVNLQTGKEALLYSFAGGIADGANPQNQGSVVVDAQGNLYGTTTGGGVSGQLA